MVKKSVWNAQRRRCAVISLLASCAELRCAEFLEVMEAGSAYRVTDVLGRRGEYMVMPYECDTFYRVLDLRDGKEKRVGRNRICKAERIRSCIAKTKIEKKQRKVPNPHLYIFKTGQNTYKVGCTRNISKRMKQGRTWCPMMEVVMTRGIPSEKADNWQKYEDKIHLFLNMFKCSRIHDSAGTEVFQLNECELHRAKTYLKRMRFD